MTLEEVKRELRSPLRCPGLLVVSTLCLAVGIATQTVVLELLGTPLFRAPRGLLLGRFVEPFLFQLSSLGFRAQLSGSTLVVLLALVAAIQPTRHKFRISPTDALSAD